MSIVKATELLHQLDTGTFMKPTKTTLAEYLERWLKDYAWPNLAPGLQQVAAERFDEAFGTKYNEPENEAIEKIR